MNKEDCVKELELRIEKHKIQIRHLENDLSLTKKEYKESKKKYLNLYSNIDEKIKIAKIEAYAANKTRSEFLANVSHELRTPLNSILGFSQILKGTNIDNTQKGYIDTIIKSGNGLLVLINDIIDISKLEAEKIQMRLEPVNIRSLVYEIENYYRLENAQKRLDFQIYVSDALPEFLRLDENRMRQIIGNLVGNAVKFTKKGFVKISVDCHFKLNNISKVDVIFKVIDSGIGINKKEQKHIFDTFKQQDGKDTKKYGGTGLGLAITNRLVQLMGGIISVSSEPGKGSVFTVEVKNVQVETKQIIDSKISDTHKRQENSGIILVVDDDENNIKILKIFLKDSGFNILEANNGKEAIRIAKKHNPVIIFLDLQMPVMGGIEAIQKIRVNNNLKSIPIIAISGVVNADMIKKAKKAGYTDYITKPFDKEDIDTIIKKYKVKLKSKKTTGKTLIRHSSDQLNRMPILKHRLENELKAKWEELSQTMILNEINDFALELFEEGDQLNLPPMRDWGKKIDDYSRNIKIEELNKTLSEFPKMSNHIIRKVENLLKNKKEDF